jgi:uncharacterized protein (TIGR03382 family)
MKNATLIATLGASTLASVASASVTTYNQYSNTSPNGWYQDVLAAAGTAQGGYYDPGTFSNWSASGTGGTAGYGWEFFTMSIVNGSVIYTGGNLVISNTSSAAETDVTFTFNYSGPGAPTGTQGVYGFGINVLFNPSASTWTGVGVNAASIGNGAYNNGFIGIIASVPGSTDPVGPPVNSVRFSFQGGTTVTITGTQYYIVPAPGAVALLGAAGLVSARRRRA